jgi:D-beta-D-heptose 7-phosphate kinase/D-beta-D-heptose 1-phosphate adenosyltransferase
MARLKLDRAGDPGQSLTPMDLESLQTLLSAIVGARVVTVGDVMVDRFVYGAVTRVSAEAPIPILLRDKESVMLGAAGNVARNIAALGAHAVLIGAVGRDTAGQEALTMVGDDPGIEGFLVMVADRPTTVKTRFVSSGQQLLRVDLEDVTPLDSQLEQRLIRAIHDAARGAGALLLSDYGKGVVTPGVIDACLAAAQAENAVLIVDSKARCFGRYGAASIVKPNAAELAYATDLPTGTDAEIELALAKALTMSACGAILVTRSAKGMTLAVRGEPVRHFRRPSPEVFDTSGAGDTALSALGAALAGGAELHQAVELALLASSVAVEKAGTATASPDELIEAELAAHRAPIEAKIATMAGMRRTLNRWRARGLRVGFTNGCFDILHPGHVAYLNQARTWCDRLIVGLNTDVSVRLNKGPDRPVNPLEARAMVLAGLSCVDLVVPFDDQTPEALIAAARPDVLIKGGDYRLEDIVGYAYVTGYGGEVRLAGFVDGHSTTATIARLAERS